MGAQTPHPKTVFRGAKIYWENGWKTGSLVIDGDRVEKVDPAGATPAGARVVDVEGAWILPGMVDAHTHLRGGKLSYKETFASGAAAAAAGGFTSCLVMANGDPVTDSAAAVHHFFEEAHGLPVRLYPVGAVTLGLEGQALTDMRALKVAGCVALSDDGQSLMNASVLSHAMRWCEALGLPLILHEEDRGLSPKTGAHASGVALARGLPMSAESAESILVARDLELMRSFAPKLKLHIAHASTRRTVELAREYRQQGFDVSLEVTPHHLFFETRKIEESGGFAKMAPPLRDEATRLFLWTALMEGHVDCVATDHAPHSFQEKNQVFKECPCGVVGLETALSTLWTLSDRDQDRFSRLLPSLTANPAKRFGLDAGVLSVGKKADFVIFDPAATWKVEGHQLKTKAGHTPWEGEILSGKVMETWVGGHRVHSLRGEEC